MTAVDPKQLRRVADWKCDDILFCIARLPETERLFVGSSNFQVAEFDVAAEKPERVVFAGEGHRSYVTGLALAGKTLVSGSYDGRLIWWDIETREQIRAVDAHERWIRRVMATPAGDAIISIADDMMIKVWDPATGELVAAVTDHAPETPHHYPSMLYVIGASADAKWLASGDKTGHVAIWDLASLEKVAQVEAPVMYTWDPKQRRHSIGGIRSVSFSPDGTKLAVGGIGTIGNIDHLGGPARLEIFDWQSGTRLHELEDNEKQGLIEQIDWHPSGAWLLTSGGDHKGFFTIYDAATGEMIKQDGNDGHVHGVVIDESFQTIYAACYERIEKWTLAAEEAAESPADEAAPSEGET